MPKRMLIDASHPEETRVVVLDGQKVEEFDFESASKRPLKGNIYLAKVTRVEPSLQAAFVEYGGNRQGFLAFSEIHPDYYQIPIADRQALIEEQQAEARRRAEEEFEPVETGTAVVSDEELAAQDEADAAASSEESASETEAAEISEHIETGDSEEEAHEIFDNQKPLEDRLDEDSHEDHERRDHAPAFSTTEHSADEHEADDGDRAEDRLDHAHHEDAAGEPFASEESHPDFGIGEAAETHASENGEPSAEASANGEQSAQPLRGNRPSQRFLRRRHYKIQEVIKRRQIILVQVVKEERGNKGAALTTYLSLAGRYCVLMPNTPRGGGISRKITNANDRKRLKSAAAALDLPQGMGLIIRTAGENRTKVEIKRDYEYLVRMWDTIRETTLSSNAPACVYEEGDLIKRAIRDLYNKDVADITVEGDEGYKNAKDFMRMLMPSHAKNVKQYRDTTPLFQSQHIEAQLDAMFQPTVTLKSGGYLVINQTEALVSIDVNSGRATREHSIEETAYKTNLEAATEIGRQLRLRDLAGLIVIDFIDMEDGRNDRNVEKRLRDAVKNDRARIQIGRISQFGLMEMSRQRLRAGVVAGSTVPCPHCGGQGIVRSVESTALRVLRGLEEEGQKLRSAAVNVRVPSEVAIYTLNQKRREIQRIESDYRMAISFVPKEDIVAGNFEIDRIAQLAPEDRPVLPQPSEPAEETLAEAPFDLEEEVEETEEHVDLTHAEPPSQAQHHGQHPQEGEGSSRRRRRRRGGRGRSSSSHSSNGQHHHPQQQHSPHQPAEQPLNAGEENRAPESSDEPDTIPQSASPITDGASSQQNGQHTEGQAGTSGRRKRRRRGGRGRSHSSPHQDGQPQQHNQNNGEHGGDDRESHTNAPSEPNWSLGADDITPVPHGHEEHAIQVPIVETPREPESIPHDTLKNASEKNASDELATPAEPPRKGWWQRTFR